MADIDLLILNSTQPGICSSVSWSVRIHRWTIAQASVIERVYYNQLRGITLPPFGVKPVLVGEQASTGKIDGPYDGTSLCGRRVDLQKIRPVR